MNLQNSMRTAGLATLLLSVSAYTQGSDNEQVIVISSTPPVQAEVLSTEPVLQVITKTVEGDSFSEQFPDVHFNELMKDFSIDIEQQRSQLQEQFEKSDRNGDGYLELNELDTRLGKLGFDAGQTFVSVQDSSDGPQQHRVKWVSRTENNLVSEEDLQRLKKDAWEQHSNSDFDEADVDGDGMLTRSEFLGRHSRWSDRAARLQLESLDSNEDRYVDFSEYSSQIEVYRQLDRNQDGIVSADEFGIEVHTE